MKNMRRGFTMIELIFVIVIIGILAAVAIPKLSGTVMEANINKHVGFVGTLNRTVAGAIWADVVNNTVNPGSVVNTNYSDYLDLYPGVENFSLAECGESVDATSLYVKIADITNLDKPASIYCLDGTSITSAKFGFDENGSQQFRYE